MGCRGTKELSQEDLSSASYPNTDPKTGLEYDTISSSVTKLLLQIYILFSLAQKKLFPAKLAVVEMKPSPRPPPSSASLPSSSSDQLRFFLKSSHFTSLS